MKTTVQDRERLLKIVDYPLVRDILADFAALARERDEARAQLVIAHASLTAIEEALHGAVFVEPSPTLARVMAMREALRPFAKAWTDAINRDVPMTEFCTIDNLSAAARALEGK